MREQDIRPKEIYKTFIELSEQDAVALFDPAKFVTRDCPACGMAPGETSFTKSRFDYAVCDGCGTLYQTPSPTPADLKTYYISSESARYWAEVFVPSVAESRIEKIVRPRVRDISRICADRGIAVRDVLDVGAGHGIFLQEWRNLHADANLLAVEPNATAADAARVHGIDVIECMAEEASETWREVADLVTSFEVIEHVFNPGSFARSLYKMCREGGIAVVSGLSVDGFDVQALWDRADAICPPNHINFCSIVGLHRLFTDAGFSRVNVITPGKLDVDIVRNKLAEDAQVPVGEFERYIAGQPAEIRESFQQYLARSRRSSHFWVIAHR